MGAMNRSDLAGFLRSRRAMLRPSEVGLPAGQGRRTPGLRREEVAHLAAMSPNYYTRLEQGRAPQPSPQLLRSLARALRLTKDERDHLFYLAGHTPSPEYTGGEVSPGLLRLLDRLTDTPAQVVSDLGEVLAQNAQAVVLLGDLTATDGPERNHTYRWFTDRAFRAIHPPEEHTRHSHSMVADLRAAAAKRPHDRAVTGLVASLRAASPEFAALWDRHDVAVRRFDHKTIVHPEMGPIEVDCEILLSEGQDQRLLVFTAAPGTEAAEKLAFLAVIGQEVFSPEV